ncbi:MAG: hypothetical protein QM820_07865 [Minicystis sp.]
MNIRYLGPILLAGLVSSICFGACGGGGGGGGGKGGNGGSGNDGGGEPCGLDGCPDNQFCDYDYQWCGTPGFGEEGAFCKDRSADCKADIPVCGCDGKLYESQCAAQAAGTDIGGGHVGVELCDHALTPQGRFACGPWFCDAATTYCKYIEGDQGDRWMSCEPLPAACNGVGSCACIPAPTEGSCEMVDGNGVTGFVYYEAAI